MSHEIADRLRELQPTAKNEAIEYNPLFTEAADELERLTAEVAAWKQSRDDAVELLSSERDALRTALRKYGDHIGACPGGSLGACDCGLDDALHCATVQPSAYPPTQMDSEGAVHFLPAQCQCPNGAQTTDTSQVCARCGKPACAHTVIIDGECHHCGAQQS